MATEKTQVILTADDRTKAAFASVQAGLAGINAAYARLPIIGTALGGFIAAGTFAVAIKESISFAAALDDMAEKTGASVENLSALSRVAAIGGHSMELLETGMVRLVKALSGADDESKGAAHALATLGLSAASLRNLDTGEALKVVADRMGEYKDGAGKTALALDLFGRSGAQLLPLLKDLGESGKLNATVTTAQAAAAEAYEKNLKRVGVAAGETTRAIAMDLLPTLTKVSERMAQAFAPGLVEGFTSRWGAAFKGLGAGINEAMATTEEALAKVTFGRVAENHLKQAIAYREAAKQIYAGLAKMAPPDVAAKAAPTGDLTGYKSSTETSGKVKVPKAAGGGYEDYSDRINQAVAGAISGSAVVKSRELADQVERLDSLFFDAGLDADIYKSALDKLNGSTDRAAAGHDRLNELIGATPTEKIKETQADMLLLAEALEAGRISAEQFNEAALTRLGALGEKVKEVDGFAREMGLTFSSAFEEAIIGGKSFSDTLKSLAQDIERIVIRKKITEPLGNALSGAIGGFDLSKLFGDFSLSTVAKAGLSMFGFPGYAQGTPYVPDDGLAFLHKGEAVVPAQYNIPGGGGGSLTINNTIDARGADLSVVPRIEAALVAMETRIYKNVPGVMGAARARGMGVLQY